MTPTISLAIAAFARGIARINAMTTPTALTRDARPQIAEPQAALIAAPGTPYANAVTLTQILARNAGL